MSDRDDDKHCDTCKCNDCTHENITGYVAATAKYNIERNPDGTYGWTLSEANSESHDYHAGNYECDDCGATVTNPDEEGGPRIDV